MREQHPDRQTDRHTGPNYYKLPIQILRGKEKDLRDKIKQTFKSDNYVIHFSRYHFQDTIKNLKDAHFTHV